MFIGEAIGGIIGAISGGIQAKQEQEVADQNLAFQREQFEYQKELNDRQFNYQKELNEKQMEREDNAVQRRAKDLEAAGLSKTLAAGSSAAAGGMSSGGAQSAGNAPQRQSVRNAGLQALDNGMMIANQFQSMKSMSTQNKKTESEIQTEAVERENIAQDTLNKQADLLKTKADTDLSKTQKELTKEHITDRQLKRDKEIQELISKTDLLKAQDMLTQQQTINAKHNKEIGDLFGLPIGASPAQGKFGANLNDLIRLNRASEAIAKQGVTSTAKALRGALDGNKESSQIMSDNFNKIKEKGKTIWNKGKGVFSTIRGWF